MRHAELLRRIERVPPFPHPRADREQYVTPAEAAATLLSAADRLDGLRGRTVVDLGCGTGRLAIGAALMGAETVVGVDDDPEALAIARTAATAAETTVTWVAADVAAYPAPADLVVMNPPFGAQRRHADRPFWDAAYRLARRSVYAFSLAASRTFIARQTVARSAQVLEVAPVRWALGSTLPHHRRHRHPLDVDLWAIRTDGDVGAATSGARASR